jgi:hypothetical protein
VLIGIGRLVRLGIVPNDLVHGEINANDGVVVVGMVVMVRVAVVAIEQQPQQTAEE